MIGMHASQKQAHCFGRLKARALTEEEVHAVGGACGLSDSITGDIIISDDGIFGTDYDDDCPRFE